MVQFAVKSAGHSDSNNQSVFCSLTVIVGFIIRSEPLFSGEGRATVSRDDVRSGVGHNAPHFPGQKPPICPNTSPHQSALVGHRIKALMNIVCGRVFV